MVDRVRNIIKSDAKKGKWPSPGHTSTTPTAPKCRKTGDKLMNRYPITNTSLDSLVQEDQESLEQHKKGISKEMDKTRQGLQLMKSTYTDRRMYILDGLNSIDETLATYPALSRPTMVSI